MRFLYKNRMFTVIRAGAFQFPAYKSNQKHVQFTIIVKTTLLSRKSGIVINKGGVFVLALGG